MSWGKSCCQGEMKLVVLITWLLLAERAFSRQSLALNKPLIIGQGLSVMEFPIIEAIDPITLEEVNWQMQNPLSGGRSLFLEDAFLALTKGSANLLLIQPVWSFKLGDRWHLITYTRIPFQSFPALKASKGPASGLGNISLSTFFSSWQIGDRFSCAPGMALSFPTRSDPELGSNCLGLGPSALFYYSGRSFSSSIEIQHTWSLNANDDNKVSQFSGQYSFYYNFLKGWYLESNATVTANYVYFLKDRWLVPLGAGPGKTFQLGQSGSFCSTSIQAFRNIVHPSFAGNWAFVLQFQVLFPD